MSSEPYCLPCAYPPELLVCFLLRNSASSFSFWGKKLFDTHPYAFYINIRECNFHKSFLSPPSTSLWNGLLGVGCISCQPHKDSLQQPLRNDCMQHTAPTVIWYLSMLVLPAFSSTVSSFLLFCPLLSCNLLFCSSVTCCCCCTPPCPCLLGLLKGNVLNSLFLFANTYWKAVPSGGAHAETLPKSIWLTLMQHRMEAARTTLCISWRSQQSILIERGLVWAKLQKPTNMTWFAAVQALLTLLCKAVCRNKFLLSIQKD